MARGPCTFRQTDVKRACKGAEAAGIKVIGIKVHRDGFVLLTGDGAEEKSDLDRELSEFEKRHGPR